MEIASFNGCKCMLALYNIVKYDVIANRCLIAGIFVIMLRANYHSQIIHVVSPSFPYIIVFIIIQGNKDLLMYVCMFS
jgi:hypothetical protein